MREKMILMHLQLWHFFYSRRFQAFLSVASSIHQPRSPLANRSPAHVCFSYGGAAYDAYNTCAHPHTCTGASVGSTNSSVWYKLSILIVLLLPYPSLFTLLPPHVPSRPDPSLFCRRMHDIVLHTRGSCSAHSHTHTQMLINMHTEIQQETNRALKMSNIIPHNRREQVSNNSNFCWWIRWWIFFFFFSRWKEKKYWSCECVSPQRHASMHRAALIDSVAMLVTFQRATKQHSPRPRKHNSKSQVPSLSTWVDVHTRSERL